MISASLVKELRELTGAGMLDCKKALEACDGDKEKAVDWLREKGISKAAKKASRIAAEGKADILINGDNAVIVEVNSETDFVAKNSEFTGLVEDILNSIMNNDPKTVEDVLKLSVNGETVEDLIINKTAKIGEKLSLRRFAKLTKNDNETFGSYIHGGRIAVLTVIEGGNEEVAKHVSMQAASMRPQYVRISDVPEEVVAREAEVLREQAMNEGKPADIAEKMVQGRLHKFYKEICLEEQEFILDGDINVKTYVKNNGGTIKEMVRYEVGEGMEKREENFAEEVAKQIKG